MSIVISSLIKVKRNRLLFFASISYTYNTYSPYEKTKKVLPKILRVAISFNNPVYTRCYCITYFQGVCFRQQTLIKPQVISKNFPLFNIRVGITVLKILTK